MIDIFHKLKGFLASLSAAEVTAAGKCKYAEVEREFDRLSVAVRAAKAADEADASSYWTDIKSKVVNFFHYDSEKSRFEREANDLKEKADLLLFEVKEQCDARIGVHRDVPADLLEDRREWRANGREVRKKIVSIGNLPKMPTWTDEARQPYEAAVATQVNALTELEGIMLSTAQSCHAGAQLNRAVFFVVKKAIRKAAGAIEGAEGSGFLTYYRRTSTAIQVLGDLLNEISAAASGGVAEGSSDALSREHRYTMGMPNLLRVGSWPTGTDGAAIIPAHTEKGVREDGKDADLRVDNNTGSDGEGVKL